jgi:hypothetical protein
MVKDSHSIYPQNVPDRNVQKLFMNEKHCYRMSGYSAPDSFPEGLK